MAQAAFMEDTLTYEEIYFKYGWYGRFVIVELVPESEASKQYGTSIMGIFLYSSEERKAFELPKGNLTDDNTRKYVRFEASPLTGMPYPQKKMLEEKGVCVSEIKQIFPTGYY